MYTHAHQLDKIEINTEILYQNSIISRASLPRTSQHILSSITYQTGSAYRFEYWISINNSDV